MNKSIVRVKDLVIPKDNYLTYNNNQSEYFSDISFKGESIIYDLSGKLLKNLGTKQFVGGKNVILINQHLNTGIYILTIKNGTDPTSYKFIVE